ncbi:unnamed protein product [Peronospora destructor]|uniref:Uncharacterized protein n=1 Tax=Peronospora destructor TaxID=86335 RepID=A0AAV0V1G5_9STRA|nr:unnamed protein product [Peronospora destructor]
MTDVEKSFNLQISPKGVYPKVPTLNKLLCLIRLSGYCLQFRCHGWLLTWPGQLNGPHLDPTCRRCYRITPSKFTICWSHCRGICWIAMGYTREMGEALGDHGDGTDGQPIDRTWISILTVFFYLWMDITINVVQTPAMLIVGDIAGDRRTTGAALGQAWSTFGLCLDSCGCCRAPCSFVSPSLSCLQKKLHWIRAKLTLYRRWKRIGHAFASVYRGIRTLPHVLAIYGICFFFIQYGFAAYYGSKGQFLVSRCTADPLKTLPSCDPCTFEQDAYNHGVSIAGGRADLIFNIVGYIYSWTLPFLVHKFGVKWMLTISTVPQTFLIIMAWTSDVTFNVFVVAHHQHHTGRVMKMYSM